MKRGTHEKSMGPMFPRLHVNDTEKGGPRAPPRNKMALYEQLSIPSQRFGGEGCVSEMGSFLPHQRKHAMQAAADKTNNRYSELNMQQEQQKKQEDEDIRVPIFVQQSGLNLDGSGNCRNKDNEVVLPSNSAFSGRITEIQKASGRNKVQLKETNGSSSFGHRNVSNNSIRLQRYENSRDQVVDSRANINVEVEQRVSKENFRAVGPTRDVQHEVVRSPNDRLNGDVVSENSMVDSICGGGISPDEAVEIIGQKHFWKARRAIVNQQRLFAVQVFELHRLIKVQRLIAGSPQLLIETDTVIGKPAKVSHIKKIPLDHTLISPKNVAKIKDSHEKPKGDTREFSAENAVEKVSLSSVQNSSWSTFTRYPSDPKMGSRASSQQPSGHQWLIPVISPSEGLVYKPYPGPGYMTPGPGPPLGHNFVSHGVPVPPLPHPHYQWPTGFHPVVPPPAHGYFPPYGMTTVNPSSGLEMNPNPFDMQRQGSCNGPTLAKFHAPNSSEVQVSTVSSPSERTETDDTLPLFPTQPPADGPTTPTRAIRVVPRKARLASESVARIFRSIQEERKQQDQV